MVFDLLMLMLAHDLGVVLHIIVILLLETHVMAHFFLFMLLLQLALQEFNVVMDMSKLSGYPGDAIGAGDVSAVHEAIQ